MKFHVGIFVLYDVKLSMLQSPIPAHSSLKMKKPAKDVSVPPQTVDFRSCPNKKSSSRNLFVA